MLEICAIASGSNGNCYYIGNEKDAVLIDAGISCKQIVQRMKERKLQPSKIKAVFITHEHSDHLSGARVFGKKMHVPVYITPRTYYSAYKNQRPDVPKFFNPGDKIEVDEFKVHSFLKSHDASEPCSFRVQYHEKSVGVFTDIGEPCENVKQQLNQCDALFLESNYDEKMLWEGSYPWFLKRRVASEVGHLSNFQAFELLQNHSGDNLRCVFLSHLSKENNTPEIALQSMLHLKHRFEFRLTSRFDASDIFKI